MATNETITSKKKHATTTAPAAVQAANLVRGSSGQQKLSTAGGRDGNDEETKETRSEEEQERGTLPRERIWKKVFFFVFSKRYCFTKAREEKNVRRRDLRKTSWRAETECTSGARTKPCNCKAFRNCRDLRKSSREKEGPTCSQREDQHKPNTANIYSKRPTSSCCLCLDIFLNRHVFQVQAISCHTNTAILIVWRMTSHIYYFHAALQGPLNPIWLCPLTISKIFVTTKAIVHPPIIPATKKETRDCFPKCLINRLIPNCPQKEPSNPTTPNQRAHLIERKRG